ncbi:transcriptional repressor CTCFL-like isoform X1 [Watersipora subatra]|uniref:transcriptional repressor CTCFL-like isoform X1 n=1 Tax=Watersipora subatra TaxID=2589382 RepID=UPI00355C322B
MEEATETLNMDLEDEFLTDEEIQQIVDALNTKKVDDLVGSVMSIEKVLVAIKGIIGKTSSTEQKDMIAAISVEQTPPMTQVKDQVVVVNVGEKEVELTDMITKDGKLRRKKAKKQMSSEEIKEKLRKLRESRDDIPMKTCEQCGYRTREPYKMRRHERTHTGEKPFKCPLCPFRGAEKSVVVKHLKSNVHSKKSSGTVMKAGTMGGMGLRIDCDQCTFTATSSQQMIKHKQNRHEGLAKKVGKLRCPFCDYRNSYQKVMDLHIKAHEEEGTSKPIIATTTETEADADGIVTVYLNDLVAPPPPTEPQATVVDSTANVDGVDELLTSINS